MSRTVVLLSFNQCYAFNIVLLKLLQVLKTAKLLSWTQAHFPPHTIKLHHGVEVGPSLLCFIYELAVVLIQNPPQLIHHLQYRQVLKSATMLALWRSQKQKVHT